VLAVRVLDHVRLRLAASIGDPDPYDGLLPGDLHGETATVAARGVPERVAAQFGRDADHIVAGRALRQDRCQPPPHDAEFAFPAFERPPPTGRIYRSRRWCGWGLAGLVTVTMRVAGAGIASHGQRTSVDGGLSMLGRRATKSGRLCA
jgi:hypothetical protein